MVAGDGKVQESAVVSRVRNADTRCPGVNELSDFMLLMFFLYTNFLC